MWHFLSPSEENDLTSTKEHSMTNSDAEIFAESLAILLKIPTQEESRQRAAKIFPELFEAEELPLQVHDQ